ncbi:unnamed protein product, partial [Nezara viridula]
MVDHSVPAIINSCDRKLLTTPHELNRWIRSLVSHASSKGNLYNPVSRGTGNDRIEQKASKPALCKQPAPYLLSQAVRPRRGKPANGPEPTVVARSWSRSSGSLTPENRGRPPPHLEAGQCTRSCRLQRSSRHFL